MADVLALVEDTIKGFESIDVVEHALSNGASVAPQKGQSSPLTAAVKAKHVELVSLLLRCKADPDVQDSRGVTCLHTAIFNGSRDTVDLLINAKADLEARDRHGQTPLFFAPHRQACAQLCAARADINTENFKGQSALHLAAHAGLNDSDFGADTSIKPYKTPKNAATIDNLLEAHGSYDKNSRRPTLDKLTEKEKEAQQARRQRELDALEEIRNLGDAESERKRLEDERLQEFQRRYEEDLKQRGEEKIRKREEEEKQWRQVRDEEEKMKKDEEERQKKLEEEKFLKRKAEQLHRHALEKSREREAEEERWRLQRDQEEKEKKRRREEEEAERNRQMQEAQRKALEQLKADQEAAVRRKAEEYEAEQQLLQGVLAQQEEDRRAAVFKDSYLQVEKCHSDFWNELHATFGAEERLREEARAAASKAASDVATDLTRNGISTVVDQLTWFGPMCSGDFRVCPQSYWKDLHAQFAPPAPVVPDMRTTPADMASLTNSAVPLGIWWRDSKVPSVLPFNAYYSFHVLPCPRPFMQALHDQFPTARPTQVEASQEKVESSQEKKIDAIEESPSTGKPLAEPEAEPEQARRSLFGKVDTNNNGIITREEFYAAMKGQVIGIGPNGSTQLKEEMEAKEEKEVSTDSTEKAAATLPCPAGFKPSVGTWQMTKRNLRTVPNSSEEVLGKSSSQDHQLKVMVATSLLDAATNGQLAKELSSFSPSQDTLESKARDGLLQAAASGDLQKVLQDIVDAATVNSHENRSAMSRSPHKPSVGTWLMNRRVKPSALETIPPTKPVALETIPLTIVATKAEVVRQSAAQVLLQGAESGMLQQILQQSRGQTIDADSSVVEGDSTLDQIKMVAATALLEAAANGNLQNRLLVSRFQKLFLQASLSGDLDKILSDISVNQVASKPQDDVALEQLTGTAAKALLQAAKSGKLEKELISISDSSPEQQLKGTAAMALLEALTNGRLEKEVVFISSAEPPSTSEAPIHHKASVGTWLMSRSRSNLEASDTSKRLSELAPLLSSREMLVSGACEAMLKAATSGDLQKVLQDLKGSSPSKSQEVLASEARDALLKAAASGNLQKVLQDLKGGSPSNSQEVLASEARDALLKAATSGNLQKVLQDLKGRSPSNSQEVLASEARDALLKAAASGDLKNVLQDLRASSQPSVAGMDDSALQQLTGTAAKALLEAASNGKLEKELISISSPEQQLKDTAAMALLEALTNGKLEKEVVSLSSAEPPSTSEAPMHHKASVGTWLMSRSRSNLEASVARLDNSALQQLTGTAAKALLEAATNGKLEKELISMSDSSPEQQLKGITATALLEAVANGKLDKEVLSLSSTEPRSVTEDPMHLKASVGTWLMLRSRSKLDVSVVGLDDSALKQLTGTAAKALLEAATNGKLEQELVSISSPEQDLKGTTAMALLEALSNGKLEKKVVSLSSAEPPSTSEAPMHHKASVGTWLMSRPRSTVTSRPLSAVLEEVSSGKLQKHLAGTAAEALLEAFTNGNLQKELISIADSSPELQLKGLKGTTAIALLEALSNGRLEKEVVSLSIATSEAPMHHKASVGTWLMSRPRTNLKTSGPSKPLSELAPLSSSQEMLASEARDALLTAAASGDLKKVLQDLRGFSQPSVAGLDDSALQQLTGTAAKALLEAASNGKLEKELISISSPEQQLKDTTAMALLEALSNGKLEKEVVSLSCPADIRQQGSCYHLLPSVGTWLTRAPEPKVLSTLNADFSARETQDLEALKSSVRNFLAECASDEMANDLEACKQNTRKALLQATSDGELGRVTIALRSSDDASMSEAGRALLQAASNGELERALYRVLDVEDAKRMASEALAEFAENGQLEQVLLARSRQSTAREEAPGLELVKAKAYRCITNAAASGDLGRALEASYGRDLETLKAMACDSLMRSAETGELGRALCAQSVNALRNTAREILAESIDTHELEEILRSRLEDHLSAPGLETVKEEAPPPLASPLIPFSEYYVKNMVSDKALWEVIHERFKPAPVALEFVSDIKDDQKDKLPPKRGSGVAPSEISTQVPASTAVSWAPGGTIVEEENSTSELLPFCEYYKCNILRSVACKFPQETPKEVTPELESKVASSPAARPEAAVLPFREYYERNILRFVPCSFPSDEKAKPSDADLKASEEEAERRRLAMEVRILPFSEYYKSHISRCVTCSFPKDDVEALERAARENAAKEAAERAAAEKAAAEEIARRKAERDAAEKAAAEEAAIAAANVAAAENAVHAVANLVSFPFAMFDVVFQRKFARNAAETLGVKADMVAVMDVRAGSTQYAALSIVSIKVGLANREEALRVFRLTFQPRLFLVEKDRFGSCLISDQRREKSKAELEEAKAKVAKAEEEARKKAEEEDRKKAEEEEKRKAEEDNPVELYFDLNYDEVDPDVVKSQVIDQLRSMGMAEEELQTLTLEVHRGSVIVKIRGPTPSIQGVNRLPLRSVTVQGRSAANPTSLFRIVCRQLSRDEWVEEAPPPPVVAPKEAMGVPAPEELVKEAPPPPVVAPKEAMDEPVPQEKALPVPEDPSKVVSEENQIYEAEVGMHLLRSGVIVKAGLETDTKEIAELSPPACVDVLEVKETKDRVRARIKEPPGWISLIDKSTGVRAAVKASEDRDWQFGDEVEVLEKEKWLFGEIQNVWKENEASMVSVICLIGEEVATRQFATRDPDLRFVRRPDLEIEGNVDSPERTDERKAALDEACKMNRGWRFSREQDVKEAVDEASPKQDWQIGDEVEVFEKSSSTWCFGEIEKIEIENTETMVSVLCLMGKEVETIKLAAGDPNLRFVSRPEVVLEEPPEIQKSAEVVLEEPPEIQKSVEPPRSEAVDEEVPQEKAIPVPEEPVKEVREEEPENQISEEPPPPVVAPKEALDEPPSQEKAIPVPEEPVKEVREEEPENQINEEPPPPVVAPKEALDEPPSQEKAIPVPEEPAQVSPPNLADELVALTDLIVDGIEYYKVGDKGRMSGEVYRDEQDGIERFEVTWYRTGLTSTMMNDDWQKHFRFHGRGLKVPTLGYEIKALPNTFFNAKIDTHYYSPGDRGRVTKESHAAEGTERFKVKWHKTGLTSTMKTDVWLKNFRPVGSSSQEPTVGEEVEAMISMADRHCEPGDRGRVSSASANEIKVSWYLTGMTSTLPRESWRDSFFLTGDKKALPSLSDELQCLPGNGDEIQGTYKAGDRGQVSKDDGSCLEVTWYRSGKSSAIEKESWLSKFRFIARSVLVPNLGDEVEALPGVDGKDSFGVGDIGKVSKVLPDANAVERFEVTWPRTGFQSTMEKESWLKGLRIVGSSAQVPSFGNEVEVLLGVSLRINEDEYYVERERGRVSKDAYADEKDGIQKFEVTWYRTGRTSTMKSEKWRSNFRALTSKIPLPSLGDEVEVLPDHDLVINGQDYYKTGDKGRVSADVYTDDKGAERIKVTWYRTGLTSTTKKSMWLRNFAFVARGKKQPSLGDEMQVLPNISLDVSTNTNCYKPGDKGCVTNASEPTEGDGLERFSVLWYRTGLTSKEKKDTWLTSFCTTGMKTPTDEMGSTEAGELGSGKGKLMPASEPVPKTEDQGCLYWEVTMEKKTESDRFGFSHSNGLEKFQKERSKNRDANDTSILSDDGPQTLVVKKIAEDGLLDAWNQVHPDAAVRPGDRIIEVNGSSNISDMSEELHKTSVKMVIARYAWYFNIDLKKRADAKKFGFKFEKPQQSHESIKITEVAPEGLLEELNQRNIAEGRSHLVVTVGMHVEVANDVGGDATKIAEVLRKAEAVSLRICRYDMAEKRRKKLMRENLSSPFNLSHGSPSP